ncbi:hypothetical protein M3Y95_00964300 [Aphelenchoides besseyi]|nr:hypothetical protein M3Y95_00964300 [Aphelenchoides besseyi]
MDLKEPYQITMLIITIITLFFQFFVLYLILRVSPRTMRSYIPYLAISCICEIIFSFNYGIMVMFDVPEVYPGAGLLISGYSKYFGQEFVNFCVAAIYALGCSILMCQNVCLIFRYLSIRSSPELKNKFTKLPVTLLVYTFVFGISIALGIASFFAIASPEEYQSILSTKNLNVPIDLNTTRILARTNRPYLQYFQGATALLILMSEVLYLIIVVYILQVLKQNSSSFSKRSILLQRQLTLLLAAELLVPLIMLILPSIWNLDICFSITRKCFS